MYMPRRTARPRVPATRPVPLPCPLAGAVDALAGDAQPAEVQPLQGDANFQRASSPRVWQSLLLGLERLRRRASGCSGSRARGRSPAAPSRRSASASCWNRSVIAPAVDRLLGEQVRGAHQHADLHAPLGQRRAQRGDHRRRQRVVDAAGEDDVQLLGRLRSPTCSSEHRRSSSPTATKLVRGPTWPPHSRPSKMKRRAPSFRNRRSSPGDGTCRYVGMPCVLEFPGLIRPAAGDDGERRPVVADRLELLAANLGRHEAENADAPRLRRRAWPWSPSSSASVSALRSSASARNGSAAAGRDRLGERGRVAHARHRPLQDRVARAVRLRERRAFGQMLEALGGGELACRPIANGLHDPGHGDAPRRQTGRERHVLTHEPDPGRWVRRESFADRALPGRELGVGRLVRRQETFFFLGQLCAAALSGRE